MIWVIIILFLVMTVVLLSGRGGFLIAGYNTASREDKSRYDEKKLCRVTGGFMALATILITVQALLGDNPPDWYGRFMGIVIFGSVALLIILCNTVCRKKEPAAESKLSAEERAAQAARDKKTFRGGMIFTVIVFAAVGIFLTTGNVGVSVEDGAVNIKASYWTDEQVKLSDIQSVTYREDFRVGSRMGGLGSFRLQEGNFQNEEFGNYTLYAYTKCKSYVVLETEGRMIVLNAQTPEETKALGERIEEQR